MEGVKMTTVINIKFNKNGMIVRGK